MRRLLYLAVAIACVACHDDPELPAGPCTNDCWEPSPRLSLDAGADERDAKDASPFLLFDDAGVFDAAADAGVIDAHAVDASRIDGGHTDAMTADAGEVDASVHDAGFIDAGAGPVAPGTYTFQRVPTPSPNAELTHVAISPDGRTMIVSERYDRVHVIELPSESLIRTVNLPRIGNESVAVSGIRYAFDGRAVVLAAVAYSGGGTFGRVIQMGPRGEMPVGKGPLFPTVAFESIDTHPDAPDSMRIVGRATGAMRMYRFDVDAAVPTFEGSVSMAVGCQDAAPVDDGFGGRTTVYACGFNGGAVGTYEGATVFNPGPSVVNTSRIAARPSGDYALFVSWASGRLGRYKAGQFTVGVAAPALVSFDLWDVAFADDGSRALITGELIGGVAQLREYRDQAYSTNGITDVSIAQFDQPPYSGVNGVVLLEAAWRPGGDCGYVVGGCSLAQCQRGYLIRFTVANGRACP